MERFIGTDTATVELFFNIFTSRIETFVIPWEIREVGESLESTAVEQVVACALVMQRARVRSPIGTSFLGEFFSGFFLTCKTNVRKL